MALDMENKLFLQTDNYNKILKNKKNFKKSPKERVTEAYVQVRLDNLEKEWTDFSKLHKELLECFGSKLKDHEYIKDDIYEQAEETYTEYKTELKSLLTFFAKCKETNKPETPLDKKSQDIELPKIVIPKFSGKYTEWVTFRDLFLSLIHNNARLGKVQKMHYLKSYLTGEAEQLLRQIPISEANYERCWEQLTTRYDNKKYLSHFIIKRLLSQKNIVNESANSLKELMDTTNDCLNGLTNLGINVESWDIIIIHILTLKLDVESRKQWELTFTNDNSSSELPTFQQFKEFITNRYRALEFLDTKSSGNRNQNTDGQNSGTVNKLKSLHVTNNQCSFCSEAHKLHNCKKFAQESVEKRRHFVQNNNFCFNCMGYNHAAKVCKSPIKCKLCHRRHHTMLHPNGTENTETTGDRVDSERGGGTQRNTGETGDGGTNREVPLVSCFSTGQVSKQVLLATALVKAESKNGNEHILRALLDQGSQANFVTESVVQDLRLTKKPIKGIISGVGSESSLVSKAVVNLQIKSRVYHNVVITVQAYVLKSITTLLPSRKVEALEWSELKDIKLADPDYGKPHKIDLLLGAAVYSQVIQEGIKKGNIGALVAQSTSLGWIISGVVDSSAKQTGGVLALHCHCSVGGDEILKGFWEMESDVGLTKEQTYTEEEKRCEEIFTSTTTRDEEGRYIVRLPFKTENPECKRGESRVIAESRLKGLEQRLKRNPELKQRYQEVIEEYLTLEHVEEVKGPDNRRKEAVYLPHHAVVREDKDTTKVRVVFNASQKGKNGVSLNDTLMVGPKIQPELRQLVMRWRLNPLCLTADIVKMYRQVKVHEEDADFQRFIWKGENPEDAIKDYRHLRVTFGTASAPFLAVRALQQLAADEGSSYPIAANRVINDFYMDDLMTGCDTVEEGIEIYEQMNELLNKGGFKLQKWTTNNQELLERIKNKKEREEEKEEINLKMDEVIKILGLTWERSTDTFRYVVNLPELQQPVTKRKIIADISRLFDPLGWLTPCIVVAKTIIQKLWLIGIDWDEEVPNDLLKDWCTYRDQLSSIAAIRIPRWISRRPNDKKRELHGFCDASKTAFAAVVYSRIIDSEGQAHVSLIAAKSKVAPVKQVSIPRLELCGAVLLTRLMLDVAKVMEVDKSELHAWTDSTIVLAWLNSHPNRWKVFVANRVSEILTSLDPQHWSHISTKQNPADCASRGLGPLEVKDHQLWFNGPSFLKDREIVYTRATEANTDLEAVTVHHVQEDNEPWDKFSSLSKLIRVMAYCRRFLSLLKPKDERLQGYLKTKELDEAFKVCIRKCQRINFEEELEAIRKKEDIKKKSPIKPLNPFLDSQNILRVGGRLENADLKLKQKHPILMPKRSYLTDLIIAHAHKQTLHGGNQLAINYVKSQYFIVGVKQLVKAHIRKCVTCVKAKGVTRNPLMGQLPEARVTPSRPFLKSGVDFAGPIQLRTAKGRGHKAYKGYICLFVCMCTRAVHLEAVTDLSTEGFLQAFKRFVARRGLCRQIWSDNGTNFVGTAKELKKLFNSEKDSIQPELAETLANNGTEWHFIPPHSPNFGGLWEAGVKSAKFHLKRVIGESKLTYEEIATVLAQIEACLNSRPLSRISSDLDEIDVLTPGHFLVGEPLVTSPDRDYEMSNISSLKRWQLTQRMLQEFWQKWSQEYLSQFFYRYRWSSITPQPKLDDIVLIKEDGLPPCRWLYGKVVGLHPGKDNVIRVVTLKTKNSIIKRPTSKLCVLPITD